MYGPFEAKWPAQDGRVVGTPRMRVVYMCMSYACVVCACWMAVRMRGEPPAGRGTASRATGEGEASERVTWTERVSE